MSLRRRRDYPYAWGTMHHGGIMSIVATGLRETPAAFVWRAWHGPERVEGMATSAPDAVLALWHFLDPEADVEDFEPRTRRAGAHPVEAVA